MDILRIAAIILFITIFLWTIWKIVHVMKMHAEFEKVSDK